MQFPEYRARRLRKNENFRRLIRETKLSTDDLVYPLFVVGGKNFKKPISSMPGNFQMSADNIVKEVKKARELGIPAVLLFGIPEKKDEMASGAFAKDGIVQQAVKRIKNEVPDILVITDVCLCEYTSHGHCGMLEKEEVQNDATLEVLAETAVSHARVGADMVAPSAMMDKLRQFAKPLMKIIWKIYRLWHMRQSIPPLSMGLSAKRPRVRRNSAIENPIRWIRPIPTRRFVKLCWMWKKARISSW
jgi:delta-aminolevulinic acid dehydratase/porphobilinogen synthase